MTDELDALIDASWIEPCWLDIASEWHDGQWSLLYAVASTGSLTLGSVRPIGDDGPMTDIEWYRSLLSDLSRELDGVIRGMERIASESSVPVDDVCDGCMYDVTDAIAFRDAVDDRIVLLDSE